MTLNYTWINLLILFGAVQALIFCIVLPFQKRHPGVAFFSAFIFVLAYNGFETFNWSSDLDQHFLFFDMFAFIVIYGLGPSLYLYVSRLLYPDIQFSRRQVLAHYALVIFQFITRIAIVVYHLLWINKIIDSSVPSMKLMQIVWVYAEPLSVIVFLLYFGAAILKLKSYKSTHAAKLHTKDKQIVIRWIRALLFAMGILAIAWPITVLAPDLFGAPFGEHYYPVELALVVFNYWVVFYGYHKIKTISLKNTPGAHSQPNQETEKNLSRLQKAMQEEKLYRDPELSINKLALLTGISAKTTSAILNQYHQVNFNDFVNGYRIKEVQERLADPGSRHLTISGIALDCGFNSQATFQRVFKNTTGKSPRDYMNQSFKKIS